MTVRILILVLAAAVVGAVASRLLPWPFGEVVTGEARTARSADEKKVLYWVAPMDPNYRRDGPGKSPMGMDLIPVYEGEEAGKDEDDVAVRITPNIVNNLGVRTARVERADLSPHIATVGYVDFNENATSHIHLRTEGWVENLKVRSIGERVQKGDLLFELYSPTLVNAQAELVQAQRSGRRSLMDAAEERLRALGVGDDRIRALKNNRDAKRTIPVYAPQDGVVSALNIGEGMYATPAKTLMSLADLSSVWVLADVFESDAHAIEPDLPASITLPYLRGESWDGTIEYLYPMVDEKTRTLKVRLRFDNPGERLKPRMYADVLIHAKAIPNVFSVPRQAVIRTGRSDRVIVAAGDGEFRPVLVKTGIEAGDRVQVLSGVSEGDEVVVSGQFLIDSESNLSGAIARLEKEAQSLDDVPEGIPGEGVVNAIMPDARTINVTHDPIPALGWPTMTMDFAVAPTVNLSALAISHSIAFTLERDQSGTWMITSVAADPAGPSAEGVLNGIQASERKINVTHQPIAELGWPAMTMDFPVADAVALDGLAPGVPITFTLTRGENGIWMIEALAPKDSEGAAR